MKKRQKQQIKEMIKQIEEAQGLIKEYLQQGNVQMSMELLEDCQSGCIAIGNLIEQTEGEGSQIVSLLEEYCEMIYQIHQKLAGEEVANPNKVYKFLKQKLIKIGNSVQNDIPVKKEAVFLSYKASMWDCLESIWKAAQEDPECDAYVIPIPYFDRNSDGSFGKMHYEGDQYPEDVPVISYEEYDLKEHRPDVIYIHNPYDACNYVTSIHPYFYSDRLKQFTDTLVYVPYCISGYTYHPENMVVCNMPGIVNADRIILQSESLKQVYKQQGIEENKLLVLGSPKIDAIVNRRYYQEIPKVWKRKCAGRKCILLNTGISTFLNEKEGIRNIRNVIQNITAGHEVFLIWRPHPLLKSTIASMRPEQMETYCELEEWIASLENVEIDMSGDALAAICFSDGLISDYSSLIFQYIFTEKPILSLTGKSSVKNCAVFCDYFASYFKRDGISIEEFIKMILIGEDRKREERISRAKISMTNTEGECGKKIYETIKNSF